MRLFLIVTIAMLASYGSAQESLDAMPYHLRPVNLPPIERTPMDGEKVDIGIPGVISDATIGGGGRFVVMHLRAVQELCVIDLNVAKIIHHLPLLSNDIVLTAGADKLVVLYRDKQLVARFNLLTGNKELVQTISASNFL